MKTRSNIISYMRNNFQDHIDECGEVNFTTLAEDTASALGHWEWLDDETHMIWDIAVDISEKYS